MIKYKPFLIPSYNEFSANIRSENGEHNMAMLEFEHLKNNEEWIKEKLRKHNADWIAFGGNKGEIYKHGQIKDYPDDKSIIQLSEEKKEVVFVYPEHDMPGHCGFLSL